MIPTALQTTAQTETPKSNTQIVEETIERWRRLTIGGAPNSSPSTVQTEMLHVILKDNAVLIEEVQRLRQEVADLKVQRRLETVRELEAQFPRRRRR